MHTLSTQSATSTGQLEEILRRSPQQQALTYSRIAQLPFLDKFPLLQESVKKHLQNTKSPNLPVEVRDPVLQGDSNSKCFRAPFSEGYDGISLHAARTLDLTPNDLWKIESNVDNQTGEVSLAAVCGQYGNLDFSVNASKDPISYYNSAYGTIRQAVTLPQAYDMDVLVRVSFSMELPPDRSTVLLLMPGPGSAPLNGFVGAEGDVWMSVSLPENGQLNLNQFNFIDLWQTAGIGPFGGGYKSQLSGSEYFVLPAGEKSFGVWLTPRIFAHSFTNQPYMPYGGSIDPIGSMIDLRAKQYQGIRRIWSWVYSENDHEAPGAIVIKDICVDFFPPTVFPGPDIR